MLRTYLDMCCLKRPFDDHSQARVRLESEAVLALLAAPEGVLEFVRGPAHDLENEQNPLPTRAVRVRSWLEARAMADLPGAAMEARTAELISLGLKNFDAFHLAGAELAGCDVFVTTDDRLLAAARRLPGAIKVRILNPVDLARGVLP